MSKTNFKELIHGDTPVLIDFYADWCGPCKAFSPVVQQLKQEMGDKLRVIKINIDNNPQLSGQLQVRSIPTVMIYQNGDLKWRATGGQSIATMKQALADLV